MNVRNMSKPKLHPKMKYFIEVEVRDKDGKLTDKRRIKSNTWVLNWYKAIWGLWSSINTAAQNITLTKTAGTTQGYSGLGSSAQPLMYVVAGAGVDGYGIIVGASDAAWDIDQYDMQSKISTGVGAGNLTYNATTLEAIAGSLYRLIRTFTNGSGGTVTVKELGIAFMWITTYYALIARDVFVSPITVPNGSTLTLRYLVSWV